MKELSSSKPRPGDLLVASPSMAENLFSRVYLYLHTFSEEGAMGFILNRPLGQVVHQVAGNSPLPHGLHDLPVTYGGPVQADQVFLVEFHSNPETNTFHATVHPPAELISPPPDGSGTTRWAFMGYAGWSAGQLDDELAREDWTWISADSAFITPGPETDAWSVISSGDTRWKHFRNHLPIQPERN